VKQANFHEALVIDQLPAAHQLLLSLEEDSRVEAVCVRYPRVRDTLREARASLAELVRLESAGAIGALEATAIALRVKQTLRSLKRGFFTSSPATGEPLFTQGLTDRP
jgi:hypothetical protein